MHSFHSSADRSRFKMLPPECRLRRSRPSVALPVRAKRVGDRWTAQTKEARFAFVGEVRGSGVHMVPFTHSRIGRPV